MKKKLIAIIIAVVVVAAAVIGAVISIKHSAQAMEISTEEAQKLLNETFDEMAKTKPLKAIAEANSARPVPAWLDMDKANYTAKVVALAKREDIDLPIEETLIVELYSK